MTDMIHIRPTRAQRVAFARWAVAQMPKVRTVSLDSFAVPVHLFVDMPEDILVGALVDGHRYISPAEDARTGAPAPGELLGVSRPGTDEARLLDCGLCYEESGEEVHPNPECPIGTDPALVEAAMTAALTAADLAALQGPYEAVPGDVLPEVPASAYSPDSVSLAPAGEEETGPFACDLCTRDYSTARGRDMHRRQKHPEATHAG